MVPKIYEAMFKIPHNKKLKLYWDTISHPGDWWDQAPSSLAGGTGIGTGPIASNLTPTIKVTTALTHGGGKPPAGYFSYRYPFPCAG